MFTFVKRSVKHSIKSEINSTFWWLCRITYAIEQKITFLHLFVVHVLSFDLFLVIFEAVSIYRDPMEIIYSQPLVY